MESSPMQPKIKTFKLGELSPAEYNPRIISDGAMAGPKILINLILGDKNGLQVEISAERQGKRPGGG